MKISALLFALFLPIAACAGVLEDMEEAMISGDTPWAIRMIESGLDINSVDAAGNTLLMQSVQRDNASLFDYLLKRRARLNTRNRNGETALSLAAYRGNLPFVQRLVQAGADVNFYGWPPLIYAAFNGHAAVVDYLLKMGAEINATTTNGSTALLFASRFGHIEVVERLLRNQADPNIANQYGATAYDWAMKTENTDIADLLLKAGGRAGEPVAIK
ncbi:MAG TPA: ankyrin repeat domain-containing protein [Accumulibacter sp.]|jgi:hypothetical protein|nr:ankyrin repeat domain-containing protein [Accumulibacter sp.]HQC80552.1 ankyrin repeat domain-containing protein [Accumulibacter sp.]